MGLLLLCLPQVTQICSWTGAALAGMLHSKPAACLSRRTARGSSLLGRLMACGTSSCARPEDDHLSWAGSLRSSPLPLDALPCSILAQLLRSQMGSYLATQLQQAAGPPHKLGLLLADCSGCCVTKIASDSGLASLGTSSNNFISTRGPVAPWPQE